ncbi:hypothetical protein OG279_26225 [Streptomyces sp. NBC_01201]|uniref:hypothetical protein n=1 Tax=unclassified Streptomyces TaxID=2593676 RepID=UPI002E127B36|nr:hypothetical protein OG725_24475 [Streptomyces sp. NBC_01213]WSQ82784.1 hypothetical protein OG725_37420 [Streptomyces sp. NBC_01213]WSR50917.1 hypothetical protein OG279_26225 [Streptomyces sp. NBC_01201]
MGADRITQLDPLTQMATAAVSMHELYTAWVDAGFTKAEAMELLKALLLKQAGR